MPAAMWTAWTRSRQYAFYHIPRNEGGAGPYGGRGLQGWQWLHVTVALISLISARK